MVRSSLDTGRVYLYKLLLYLGLKIIVVIDPVVLYFFLKIDSREGSNKTDGHKITKQ